MPYLSEHPLLAPDSAGYDDDASLREDTTMTTHAHPPQDAAADAVPSIPAASVGSLDERRDADFLTLSEVAGILGVPINTLRWWRQQNAGPAYFKIGRRLVTTVGDLKTWVEEQKHGNSPDAA